MEWITAIMSMTFSLLLAQHQLWKRIEKQNIHKYLVLYLNSQIKAMVDKCMVRKLTGDQMGEGCR